MSDSGFIIHGPTLAADRRASYVEQGLLAPGHMRDGLRQSARAVPDQVAVEFADRRLTYRELQAEVDRAGRLLRGLGVAAGDRVCWQVPNWWEAYVVALACWELRAVSVPIVPLFRERELSAIVEAVKPAAVVAPGEYRGHLFLEMWDKVLADAPVARVAVRGTREGWAQYDDTPADVAATEENPPVGIDLEEEPCLIMFSSGTTAAPKAVVHCSRSLLAETHQAITGWEWNREDVAYIPWPMQHLGGLLLAAMVPVVLGGRVIVEDRWDAERALRAILEEGVTISSGTTVILRELLEASEAAGVSSLPLKAFGCGGAVIPSSVMDKAEKLGMRAFRQYGMTELPSISVMNGNYSRHARSRTDGKIAPGVEVRVLDPVDGAGELSVRGPELMLGYLDAEDAKAFQEDGWFRTGDVGRVDADGFVTIEGRIKDIINRGGEKYSAVEVEEILTAHPAVAEAAVVAMPHPRLGETGCAVVLPSGTPGEGLEEELIAYLRAQGLARHKIPERVLFVTELPRTPAGKVRKVELQKLVAPTPA
jgi:acyl-CoA synthetase (AMP-forming)/AMP-acid ligase II